MSGDDYPRHIVATSALVTRDSGEVLLVKSPRRGWEFPGGQVEEGEDLITATVRETLEESGVTVRVGPLVGVYTNITPPSKVMFGFMATYISGELTTSPESEHVEWVPRDAVLDRITHAAIKDRMRDMLEFNGRAIYRVYTSRPYTVISERWLSDQ